MKVRVITAEFTLKVTTDWGLGMAHQKLTQLQDYAAGLGLHAPHIEEFDAEEEEPDASD